MSAIIEYYAALISPWTYMGHDRICKLAHKYNATIKFMPADFGVIFEKTGGLPLGKRSPERRKYRFQELNRWREELQIDLVLEPKFFPVSVTKASLLCIQASQNGQPVLDLAGAIMRAAWAEDRDISDDTTLIDIANSIGLNGAQLLEDSANESNAAIYEKNTHEAIAKGAFGAPTYIIGDDIYWGQDRLFFVEKKLQQEA